MGEQAKRFPFTKAALDALPVPARRTFYYDTHPQASSLAVQVMPSGGKTFYVYRWDKKHGKPQQLKIGPYAEWPIPAARVRAMELSLALEHDEDPAGTRKRKLREMTFGDMFEWYITNHAKAHKRSWQYDVDLYEEHLALWAPRKLSSITRSDVRAQHTAIKTKGDEQEEGKGKAKRGGPVVANRVLALVRVVFNKAIVNDMLAGGNPAVGVERFKEVSRDRRLSAGEMEAFLESVRVERSVDARDFVLLAMLTGARKSEVLSMRWDHIDEEGKTWRMPITKNGKPLVSPLLEGELVILKERRKTATGEWVFPGRSKAGHMTDPRDSWKSIVARANIKDLHIHDLRRTLSGYMLDTGSTLAVVGRALNHQSAASTAPYARLHIGPIRDGKGKAHDAMGLGIRSTPRPPKDQAARRARSVRRSPGPPTSSHLD